MPEKLHQNHLGLIYKIKDSNLIMCPLKNTWTQINHGYWCFHKYQDKYLTHFLNCGNTAILALYPCKTL